MLCKHITDQKHKTIQFQLLVYLLYRINFHGVKIMDSMSYLIFEIQAKMRNRYLKLEFKNKKELINSPF